MANPFNNATQGQQISVNHALNVFKNMMSMGSNPNQIMQVLTAQNPQMANVLQEIQKSGLTPLDYAKQMALKQNINVNPMIEQMMALTKK